MHCGITKNMESGGFLSNLVVGMRAMFEIRWDDRVAAQIVVEREVDENFCLN